MNYGHFDNHCHTMYSNISLSADSIIKPEKLLDRAKELGLKGVAITDHAVISSHVKVLQYYKKKCEEDESWKDFTLGLGEEIYLCENGRNKETAQRGQRYPHCIVVAKDEVGHRQLRQISSKAWERSFTLFVRRVPSWYSDLEEVIGEEKGHLILTSACVGGILRNAFENNKSEEDALKILTWMKKWIGEDFYLEIAPAEYAEVIEYNKWIIHLSKKYNIKLVFACDAHYLKAEDFKIHEAYLQSKDEERETADFYKYTYLQDDVEARKHFYYIDDDLFEEMINNSHEMAKSIKSYDLFCPQIIPHLNDDREKDLEWKKMIGECRVNSKYEYINKYVTSESEDDRYFIYLVLRKLKELNLSKEKQEQYLDRIEKECLEYWLTSERLGQTISSYILMVREIERIMWEEAGSLVGISRGCLKKGALVLTENGYVPIEEIKKGDRVYNHLGEIEEIETTHVYPCEEELINVRTLYGFKGITMTKDHKVLVSRHNRIGNNPKKRQFKKDLNEPEWIRADEIAEDDFLVFPKKIARVHKPSVMKIDGEWLRNGNQFHPKEAIKIKCNVIPYDYDLGKIFGIFISDGCLLSNKKNMINFAQRKSEDKKVIPNLMYKVFGLKPYIADSKKSDLRQYCYSFLPLATEFGRIFKDYKYNAHTKYIPDSFFQESEEFLRGLLDGLWYGDGTHSKSSTYTTVSYRLAIGVCRLLSMLGLPSSLTKENRKGTVREYYNPEGKDWIDYQVRTIHNFNYSNENTRYREDKNYIYKKVVSISPAESDGLVYDITVPKEHSYVTLDYIVHNSAGSTLVNYLCGLTQMNPMEQGIYLPEWRFIHHSKIELPDVDVDSEASKKELIRAKLKEKAVSTGGDAVAICTFGTEGARSAILTSARSLGLTPDEGQYISSLIKQERGFSWSISDCYYGNKDKDREPVQEFVDVINKHPGLLEISMGLEGLVSRSGIHACFDKGSLVLTDKGYKNIEDIEIGDMVLTHNNRYRKVLNTHVNYIKPSESLIEFSGKNIFKPIVVTSNHPFYAKQDGEVKWITADLLTEDDEIYLVQKDRWFKIGCKRLVPSKLWLYNLEVEEDNSFTVSGIAVHNCGINVLNHPIYYNNALMKAPNGTEITQFDLGDSDYLGGLKMDCLTVEALDKIHKCMDLLLKDGYMEWQGSLRKTYDKYLHPDVLDRDSSKMWDIISKNKMIDAFQMDSTVAKQSLAAIKPTTIPQLAQLNTLMRLMPEKGEKTPVEEYVEFKEHPNKLKEDIYKLNATEEEKKILYDFMKPYGGILDSQESAMLAVMLPFTNYDVPHANKIRKIIAKKKLKEVDAAREEYYKIGLKNGVSKDILWYIWDVNIKRQMAYSFSLPHTTAYSLICLQEMNLSYYYPPIYWATAVLTVNAGALENEESTTGTNYKKVASAIGRIQTEGYEVKLPDVNEAGFAFTPNAKENSIIYGLKGISEINDDFIKIIIQNRPYTSVEDFIEKCQPQKKQIINLIKAGVFNEFGDRRKIMKTYLASICPKKARITLQNMSLLIEYSLIPKDLQNYVYLFNFNRYIKQYETPDGFKLDQRARSFIERNYGDLDYETGFLDKKVWKKTYDKAMGGIKEWFKDNEEELINKIQEKDIEKIWNQYCQGSNSAWEMEVLGFYHSPHELLGLKADVVNPKNLVDGNYRHTVNIAGTVLGKDAYKHMVTILTTYGVVDLKFTNEQFAEYNRTISEVRDGVKKVLEKSWFIKGTLVFVKGFKSGETFRVKQISKIIDIDNKGVPKMTRYRYGKY